MFGYILCGGASVRMGSCKALQLFDNEPLIHHMIQKILLCSLKPVLVQKPSQAFAISYPCIFDTSDDFHPLFGVATALSHAKSQNQESALILPCDVPLLKCNAIELLLRECPSVAFDEEDFAHPLIAHYPSDWKDWAFSLAKGQQATKELAKVSKRVTISSASLKNCNYPQDLQ